MSNSLEKLKQAQQDVLKGMAKDFQKEQESRESNYQNDFEDIQYSPIEQDKVRRLKFYRVLGWPIHLRHEDPLYSPKIVMIARAKDDNNRERRLVLPTKDENPNHIFYRLIDKVLAGDYDKETNTKRFYYNESHPELFHRVFKNSETNERRKVFETGWKPTQYVIMNVIDREMMDWHKENKHSVLVSKKASTSRKNPEIVFYEPGTTMAMYTAMMSDEVAGIYGYPINYDIVVRKLSEQPWYKVYHSTKDFQRYAGAHYDSEDQFKNDYPFFNPSIHERDLTEEEMSWERYNIEELFGISSYTKIFNQFKGWFKKFDEAFGEKLTDELESLAQMEKKNNPGKTEEKTTSSVTITKETPKQEVTEPKKDGLPVEEKPQSRERKSSDDNFDIYSLANTFKALDKLTDEEKSFIVGYDNEKGTLIYSEEAGKMYECLDSDNCSNLSPEFYHICPKCGVEF